VPFCAPQLVFQKTWLAQTAALSIPNVFTPQQTGVYRVTISLRGPSQPTYNVVLLANLNWTQQYSGATVGTFANIVTFNNGSSQCNSAIDTITSSPISLVTSYNGTASYSYDLSIAIEQLA